MSYTNQKSSRSITKINNWKKNEITHIIKLRDEMLENNIDNNLIKQYIDDQYEQINSEYEKKIKNIKIKGTNDIKIIEIKRKKAILCLLKNKDSLEEKGIKSEYITKYLENQYNEINRIYNIDQISKIDTNLDQVNFID
jgi:hypothetical protein